MTIPRTLTYLTLFLLAACASLTPEGSKVRVTNNPQATAGCKFLGNVKGKFDNDLRNEAAKLGANVVFNMTQPNEPHIYQHGEAYFLSPMTSDDEELLAWCHRRGRRRDRDEVERSESLGDRTGFLNLVNRG